MHGDIKKVRMALSKGMSIRAAPEKICMPRNTVRKILRSCSSLI